MYQDTTYTGINKVGNTDNCQTFTDTQVASCAFGNNPADRRRRSLRAKLEREHLAHQKKQEKTFINTLCNFFSTTRH